MEHMKDINDIRRENLISLIKKAGSQKALADSIGVSKAYINQLVNKKNDESSNSYRNIGKEAARKIEVALGLNKGWLDIDYENNENSDYISLEHYDIHSSAGYGAKNEHLPEIKQLEVLREWANENLGMDARNRIKVIYNKGVSMHPTIRDGDLLFVDIKKNFFDGDGIYVIDIGGDLLTKRLVRDITTGDYLVVSDNTNAKYETARFNKNNIESLTICGRVRKIMTFTEPI